MENINLVSIEAVINAPVEKVWKMYTSPEHVVNWNFASPEWHSPKAENDLKEGGRFNYRMEAKDGSAGFDFCGSYTLVEKYSAIEYTMDDDRGVKVVFERKDASTIVTVVFEAEKSNSVEMQKSGWQSILDNFKMYVEANN